MRGLSFAAFESVTGRLGKRIGVVAESTRLAFPSLFYWRMETIRCTVSGIIYRNDDNGYSVLSVSVADGRRGVTETAVGTFADVSVGMTLSADGEWRDDRRYGRQFAVSAWREVLPDTTLGMERYLGSGMIRGIGPSLAKRIVSRFGLETFDVLDNDIERISEVSGIGKEKMARIMESWSRQNGVRDVMVFLQGHGVSSAYAVRIYKQYGKKSIEKVKENPYCLADDVFGIGFKMADQIASTLGYGPNDIRRCKAGVIYTLKELSNDGHCYAEYEQLVTTAVSLLSVERRYIRDAIDALTAEEGVIAEQGDIFLPMLYYSEVGVANKLRRMLKDSGNDVLKGFDLEKIETDGIVYDDVQVSAINEAMRSKVMVLTGGPGTGKSTTTNGIIAALETFKKRVLCAAPTGRAAKRLSEVTGKEAKTIHRMLGFTPSGGFEYDEDNPLDGDVLIVDEASMIDILLMNSLIKAVPQTMRLIFVGDIDQLPSVGAGNVLRDLIDSGEIPVVRLTRIFRQAMTSRIVTNAHRINRGEYPDVSNGKDSDFFFIKETDAEKAAGEIVNIVRNRIPKAYGYEPKDIQVLVPMKNGAAGTKNLNIALQEAINPVGECITSGAFKYRVGDKVMQIRNDYKKNVFNGDIGFVKAIDTEEHVMTVTFGGEDVEYEKGDMSELTLAYACTIHKSQGSEYPVVVMPLLMSHYIMLQRNLVYTGVTRAKKLCVVIGDGRAMHQAINNQVVLKRNTRLKERLMGA